MDERMNAFERHAAKSTLADDRKTCFQKNDERRAAERQQSHGLTSEEAAKPREEQRAAWVGDKRCDGVKTASGVTLDAETTRLKKAAEESRAPKPIAPPLSNESLRAMAFAFSAVNAEFYRSEHNRENLANFVATQIAAGRMTGTLEDFQAAHAWLVDNGYGDFPLPHVRTRGQMVTAEAPNVFPRFVDPEERLAEAEEERARRAEAAREEIEQALAMPFADLQKTVRSGNPHYGHRPGEAR